MPHCCRCARPLRPAQGEACPACAAPYCGRACRARARAEAPHCLVCPGRPALDILPFQSLAAMYLRRAPAFDPRAAAVRASARHGRGVFAARALPAGRVVSLMPLDALFNLPAPAGADEPVLRDPAVALDFRFLTEFADIPAAQRHPLLRGAFSNPLKRPRPHFAAQFTNDATAPVLGAAAAAEVRAPELGAPGRPASAPLVRALLGYWLESLAQANSALVLDRQPASLVTLRPVRAGEELTACYGPGYWLQHLAGRALDFDLPAWLLASAQRHGLQGLFARATQAALRSADEIAARVPAPGLAAPADRLPGLFAEMLYPGAAAADGPGAAAADGPGACQDSGLGPAGLAPPEAGENAADESAARGGPPAPARRAAGSPAPPSAGAACSWHAARRA